MNGQVLTENVCNNQSLNVNVTDIFWPSAQSKALLYQMTTLFISFAQLEFDDWEFANLFDFHFIRCLWRSEKMS